MLKGIETFKDITKYDIESFFSDYIDFVSTYYQSIVDYYNGGKLNSIAFKKVDELLTECDTIEALFGLNEYQFNTVDFWQIQEVFSEVYVNLLTCKKMSKWARSSRLNQFDSSLKLERGLRQFETFERVSSSLGSNDSDNDWSKITIDNLITEEDYTTNGGVIFSVKADNGTKSTITNIVDSLSGENVYGKDIRKDFKFSENDLTTVTGYECLSQSLETKLNTIKGDIPEFPDRGLSPQSTSTNVNSIQYPSIFRNLLSMFQGDGRWSEINLLDIGRQDDMVFIKIEAKTILGDSLKTNLKI